MSKTPSVPDYIRLDHGSGGRASHDLHAALLLPLFANPELRRQNDAAEIAVPGGRIAFSTDSYVVDPLFFPGGSIGSLAVHGTVNDLAMAGASPSAISCALIIEEGFSTEELSKILSDMQAAAVTAGVSIVTGDTKVVPKGKVDKLFINTAGVGIIPDGISIAGDQARPGDAVIVSGTIGDHGIAVMTARESLSFDVPVASDSAPLNHMVADLIRHRIPLHVLRDPTRGGIATTLNEIAAQSRVGIEIIENDLPIRPAVSGICDLLGYDPLHLANEGKFLIILPRESAENALSILRTHALGVDAVCIGHIIEDHPGQVQLKTPIGGTRILDMLTGEQLPRIC